MPWGIPAHGNSGPLIPPHFYTRRTLAVDSFIDTVGQNWSRSARLRTLLQRTVIQRVLRPRWPQLSQIAWDSEIGQRFPRDKEVFSGNTVIRPCTTTLRLFTAIKNVSILTLPCTVVSEITLQVLG